MGALFAYLANLPAKAENGNNSAARLGISISFPFSLETQQKESMSVLIRSRRAQTLGQVRVEERVIVRIAPSSAATRARLMAELPRRPMRTQFQEEEYQNCVAVEDMAGVQPIENRKLLIITKDRKMLTATLDRNCNARAFYLGFYIERNNDGRVCVNRDQLQARTGAACMVSSFQRLVAVQE